MNPKLIWWVTTVDPHPVSVPCDADCVYSLAWHCSRINCTVLSWEDVQATQRAQGQKGLEGKVSMAHKTKRYLRFNKINMCCWKELPGLSHGGKGDASSVFSSLGFAVTPHKWKAPGSLAWNCNKSSLENNQMILSLMIISFGPFWVILFHWPGYLLLTFLLSAL